MELTVAQPQGTGNRPAAAVGLPLSVGQEALWFLQALAPESSAYNVAAAMSLHFPVDAALMAAAVRRAVFRHGALTDVFRPAVGGVRRFRATTHEAEPEFDVHELPDADDTVARRYAQHLAQRPFRLDQRPPVRITLLRRPADPDILLVTAHHIVADDVSQMLLFRDVLDEYAVLARGTEPRVADDTGMADAAEPEAEAADITAFDDFVDRQRGYLSSPRAEAARAYWRGELHRLPEGDSLPTDHPRPAVHRFEGTQFDCDLPPAVTAEVERAAGAHNVTVFAYLLSVFQVLLYTAGGSTDCLIGYPVTQRSGRLRGSVGYYVNVLPFRGRIDPEESFDAVLRRTTRTLWRGLVHRDFPFPLMPQLTDAKRDPSRPGLLSVMFVMNADDPADPFFATVQPGRRVERDGLAVSRFDVPQQHGQVDLTMQIMRSGADARVTLKYNTSLFTARTARSLTERYVRLLRSAANDALPSALRELAGPNTGGEGTQMDQGTAVEQADRTAQIRDIAADVLSAEPGDVEAARSFKDDLDADSLLAIELLTRLEKHFDVAIADSELPRLVTNLRTAYEVVAESAGW